MIITDAGGGSNQGAGEDLVELTLAVCHAAVCGDVATLEMICSSHPTLVNAMGTLHQVSYQCCRHSRTVFTEGPLFFISRRLTGS